MKTVIIGITAATSALLFSLFFPAPAPIQAGPATTPLVVKPVDSANQGEVKHVGMGENQPL